MEPNQFREAFKLYVQAVHGELASNDAGVVDIGHLAAWTLLAETPRKPGVIEPVGFVFGRMRPETLIVQVESVAFAFWAPPRARYHALVGFYSDLQKRGAKVFAFVPEPERRIYDSMMKMGIMRRIGTSHSVLGERGPVYETRTK